VLLDIGTDTYVAALTALRWAEANSERFGLGDGSRYTAARLDLQMAMRREIQRELHADATPAPIASQRSA
jgi:hypothetical protein